MNLFEAIFVRKSVRSYTNEGISPKVLEDILKQFDEINGLFGGVETELAIFDKACFLSPYLQQLLPPAMN